MFNINFSSLVSRCFGIPFVSLSEVSDNRSESETSRNRGAFVDRRPGRPQILMDPWGHEHTAGDTTEDFEDNFTPRRGEINPKKLADSAHYLALLEKRLRSVRAKNSIVENLAAYRADCIERLMRDGCTLEPVIGDTDQERLLEK